LENRLLLASSIWGSPSNNTLITFHPAFDDPMRRGQFQTIPDPCPPGSNCSGELGDIFDEGGFTTNEEQVVVDSCRAAWARNAPSAEGIITVNIRRFVGAFGASPGTLGYTTMPYPCNAIISDSVCRNPFAARPDDVDDVAVILTDSSFMGFADDVLVAHELGHALGLGHGDGFDNNGNCVFDECCDPAEPTVAENLMNPNRTSRTITELQRITARALAFTIPGTHFFQVAPRAIFVLPSVPASALPRGFCHVGSIQNTNIGPSPARQ
jgi:hypothetical protein